MVSGPLPITIDADTLRRAQHGEVLALNAVLGQLEPYVGRICAAIALDEGPDATQEALLIVFRNLTALREPRALAAWARSIAVREAIRIARRRPLAADPIDIADVPDPLDPETRIDVRRTLERLSPEHRAVLVLHAYGVDESAMADHLGIARGTVKSRLSRARDRFRKEWRS